MASYYIGLSILSNNRLKRAEHAKLLSAEGLRILSLLEGRAVNAGDIAREENGRPFFPDRHSDFNISHSGNMAAVSLVTGAGCLRTGCDIQLVKPRAQAGKIAKGFFSEAERDYIFSRDSGGDDEAKFFHIWALKECYIKLRGFSVFFMNHCPSFISGEGRERFAFGAPVTAPISFSIYELASPDGRYILAAAIEGAKEAAPEIRWFSQPLRDKSIAEIKAVPSPAETVRAKI